MITTLCDTCYVHDVFKARQFGLGISRSLTVSYVLENMLYNEHCFKELTELPTTALKFVFSLYSIAVFVSYYAPVKPRFTNGCLIETRSDYRK